MHWQVSFHQSCWTQATEFSAQCAIQENSHHSSARCLCLFFALKNSPARWSMKLDKYFFLQESVQNWERRKHPEMPNESKLLMSEIPEESLSNEVATINSRSQPSWWWALVLNWCEHESCILLPPLLLPARYSLTQLEQTELWDKCHSFLKTFY